LISSIPIVAAELYGRECPVALGGSGDWEALAAAARLVVSAEPSAAAISLLASGP
jgi:hypothetical protein